MGGKKNHGGSAPADAAGDDPMNETIEETRERVLAMFAENPFQLQAMEAVEKQFSKRPPIPTMIRGPPGSGKTFFAVGMVVMLMQQRGIIIAPTDVRDSLCALLRAFNIPFIVPCAKAEQGSVPKGTVVVCTPDQIRASDQRDHYMYTVTRRRYDIVIIDENCIHGSQLLANFGVIQTNNPDARILAIGSNFPTNNLRYVLLRSGLDMPQQEMRRILHFEDAERALPPCEIHWVKVDCGPLKTTSQKTGIRQFCERTSIEELSRFAKWDYIRSLIKSIDRKTPPDEKTKGISIILPKLPKNMIVPDIDAKEKSEASEASARKSKKNSKKREPTEDEDDEMEEEEEGSVILTAPLVVIMREYLVDKNGVPLKNQPSAEEPFLDDAGAVGDAADEEDRRRERESKAKAASGGGWTEMAFQLVRSVFSEDDARFVPEDDPFPLILSNGPGYARVLRGDRRGANYPVRMRAGDVVQVVPIVSSAIRAEDRAAAINARINEYGKRGPIKILFATLPVMQCGPCLQNEISVMIFTVPPPNSSLMYACIARINRFGGLPTSVYVICEKEGYQSDTPLRAYDLADAEVYTMMQMSYHYRPEEKKRESEKAVETREVAKSRPLSVRAEKSPRVEEPAVKRKREEPAREPAGKNGRSADVKRGRQVETEEVEDDPTCDEEDMDDDEEDEEEEEEDEDGDEDDDDDGDEDEDGEDDDEDDD